MYSMDETYHVAHDIIFELHNQAPAIPAVKLGNGNKEAIKTLA